MVAASARDPRTDGAKSPAVSLGAMSGDGHEDPARADDHGAGGRTTAPMSEFTDRQAGVGALIAATGVVLVFAVPYLLG